MSTENTPQLNTPEGLKHDLTSPCEIGRADECNITLSDTQVSRHHCILQNDSRGTWWITDQESTNGTYVNSRRINQATKLRNNDAITIGNQQFFFYCEDSEDNDIADIDTVPQGTTINFSQINCWLLVGDIISSTALSQEKSPQELNKIIGDWGAHCREVIEQFGGEINKFLGDGYFAFWRNPSTDGSHITEAIKSIYALRKDCPLEFRLILHYGQVQLGGVMTKGEENLSGTAVNYVFKAEKVASSLGQNIFVSDTAAAKMQAAPLKSIGCYAVPGFPGENAFFTLDFER